MNEPAAILVPTRSDKDIANELRAELEVALKPVCAICDRAKEYGMLLQFAVGLDYRGLSIIQSIKFIKEL